MVMGEGDEEEEEEEDEEMETAWEGGMKRDRCGGGRERGSARGKGGRNYNEWCA